MTSPLGQGRTRRRSRAAASAALAGALLFSHGAAAQAAAPTVSGLTQEGADLLAAGRLDDALQRFRDALALRPGDPALEFNVGLALFRLERFDEALAPLERATAHPPSAPQARYLRGIVFFQAGDFPRAAAELEAAGRDAPLGEQALYMLVESSRKAGSAKVSQAAFLELGRRFPGSAFYHKLMGMAYDAEGMLADALREFGEAARKNPHLPEVAFAIGVLHFKERAYGQAVPWLEKELAVQPCHAKAHYYLGEIAAAAEQPTGAEERYRESLACDSRNPQALAGIGALYAKLGRHEEALGPLSKAASLDPENAEVQYSLGRTLLRLGRREAAQAAFRKVDAIHAAKHATAQRALGATEEAP